MSNLIENICRIRDCLLSKNIKNIDNNLFKIKQVEAEIRRQVKKNGFHNLNLLEFNSYDISELAEEVFEIIKICEKEINFNKIYKNLVKNEELTNEKFNKFTIDIAKYMHIRACLTEIHSLLTYIGIMLKLLEIQHEQNKIDNILAETIMNLL